MALRAKRLSGLSWISPYGVMLVWKTGVRPRWPAQHTPPAVVASAARGPGQSN